VDNYILHSLFSQCRVTLNVVSVSSSKDLYNYRAYLETLLTYGQDASQTHLTSTFWCRDDRDLLAHNTTADTTNPGYQSRMKLTSKSAEIETYGRVHGDLFKVPLVLLPGVQLQI
jgi:hypothetical protein